MNYQTIDGLSDSYLQELKARFYSKLKPAKDSDCLEWQAARTANGYGRIGVSGKWERAHRVAYELANGPIPGGILVCHHCDNRACCNPDHLFLGTVKDNAIDMMSKGRGISPFYNGGQVGEKNHSAILTANDVRRIRKIYATGRYTLKQIARQYDVHLDTISKAINRVTWSHLD
jgi:hypothetical protein